MTRLKRRSAPCRSASRSTASRSRARPSRACCCPISCATSWARPAPTSAASTASAAPAPCVVDGVLARVVPHARGAGRRRERRARSKGSRRGGPARRAAAGVPPSSRAAVRLLHAGHSDVARPLSRQRTRCRPRPRSATCCRAHLCRCTGYTPIIAAALEAAAELASVQKTRRRCLISARTFLASVERDPHRARAGRRRAAPDLRAVVRQISALVAAFDRARPQARRPLCSRCCKTAGRWRPCTGPASSRASSITPLNWRAKADELDYCIENAEACAIVYRGQSPPRRCAARALAAQAAAAFPSIPRRGEATQLRRSDRRTARRTPSRVSSADDWSLMLYTSGTTGAGQRACRAAIAPNVPPRSRMSRRISIGRGERTLGVMPLYHTMGVRSLLAMSLIDGCFVCLPRFDAAQALDLIAQRARSPTSIWCRRSITTCSATRPSPAPTSPRCASSASPARR